MKKRTLLALVSVVLSFFLFGCHSIPEPISIPTDYTEDSADFIEPQSTAIPESTSAESHNSLRGSYLPDDLVHPGFYVVYDDGSLERLTDGSPGYWESMPMTYGTDYLPNDLVIDWVDDILNTNVSQANGSLAIYFNNADRGYAGITPVNKTFHGMSWYNEEDGNDYTFLFHKGWNSNISLCFWRPGTDISHPAIQCNSVNGTPAKEWGEQFEADNTLQYLNVPLGESYDIEVVDGSSLRVLNLKTNMVYYDQKNDSTQELDYTPTANGYALINTSNLTPGDYIVFFSFWKSEINKRVVYTTHIVVP